MSVYTHISDTALTLFLAHYELGELVSYTGIEAGIENTNYFVRTTQGEWVLTLFEHHPADDVEQFVALANHLGQSDTVPVPAPLTSNNGIWLHELLGKPAILCPRLPGKHVSQPEAQHCFLIGEGLADLHLTAQHLTTQRANERGFDWWVSMAGTLKHQLDEHDFALLQDEIHHQTRCRSDWLALPQGWVHGDLFHDNALFEHSPDGIRLGAILDLYNACQDALAFDLAIVANDWCCNVQGEWLPGRVDALLDGYQSRRSLTDHEKRHWPTVLRGAALRFWLSRLLTQSIQASQTGAMAIEKDPAEFRNKLQYRRQYATPLI